MSGFKTQPPVMMCGMNVAGINEGLAHDEFSLMPTLKDCTTGPQFQMMYDFLKRKNHESN